MSCIFRCCCPRKAQAQEKEQQMKDLHEQDSSQFDFDESEMLRPSILDTDLETCVRKWEFAINSYREYETGVLDRIDEGDMDKSEYEEILSVLEKVRAVPEQYLNSDNDTINRLAVLRCDIYKFQIRLGLSREPTDDENSAEVDPDFASSPMHESGDSNSNSKPSIRADPLIFRSLSTLRRLSVDSEFHDNKNRKLVTQDGTSNGWEKEKVDTGIMQTPSRGVQKSDNDFNITPGEVPYTPSNKSTLVQSINSSRKSSVSLKNSSPGVSDQSITKQLSITWAGRLDEVDHTQGSTPLIAKGIGFQNKDRSIEQENLSQNIGSLSSGIKIKPKWPQFLLDVSFNVLKWNNFGRKQQRIIKLTQYHILNVKGTDKISKIYWYLDIGKIWLENATTLKIILKSGTSVCYISPMAPSIVQQITTRVRVRIALEKTTFSSAVSSNKSISEKFENGIQSSSSEVNEFLSDRNTIHFSHSAAQQMIETIEHDNDMGTSEVMASFAQNLVDRIKSSQVTDDSNASKQPENKREKGNMMAVVEGTKEFMIHKEIQEIVFDDNSNEGNTRKVFIDTFDPLQKSLLDIRHFIDGLHEYLMSSRGLQLCLMVTSFNQEDHKINQPRGGGSVSEEADKKNDNDSSRNSNRIRNSTRKSIRGVSISGNLSSIDEDILMAVSYIAFTVIEEAIFVPLRDVIHQMLPSATSERLQDELLVKKMKVFYPRSQEQWNILKEFQSPLNWESSVFELNGLDRAITPSMKLHALVRTCKAIVAEYKHSIIPMLQKTGKTDLHLGADDLVPIFVFVFCRSSISSPHLYKELMWNLCHPDQLHGECGYYLTVFESAIEFVQVEPVDDIPTMVQTSTNLFPKENSSLNLNTDEVKGIDISSVKSKQKNQGIYGGVNIHTNATSGENIESSDKSTTKSGDSSVGSGSSDYSRNLNRRQTVTDRLATAILGKSSKTNEAVFEDVHSPGSGNILLGRRLN